jgi:hypothetical protein
MGMRNALIIGCVVAIAVAAPAGAATWSAPVTVAGSHTSFPHPFSVASGADGTIAVIFRHRGDFPDRATVLVAVRRPGGRWEKTRTVSDTRFGAAQPRVAVDPRGRVLAVWARPSSRRGALRGPYLIQARSEDAHGHWGPLVTLGASAHFFESSPGIAFDAHGDATVVWRGYRRVGSRIRDVIKAAYRPAGGRFGAAASVSPATTAARSGPVVAMSPGGRSYVAWTTGVDEPAVDAAARSRAGRWGAPQRLSTTKASEPRIAVASDGAVVVAWREAAVDTEGNGTQAGGVGAAIGTPAGSFSAPQHVADAQTSGVLLVAAPTGETLLAWDSTGDTGFSYAVRAGGGGFGAARQVPGAHADALALLARGATVAFWSEDGVHASVRPAGGDFATARAISPTGSFPAAAPGGAVVWLDDSVLRIATVAR